MLTQRFTAVYGIALAVTLLGTGSTLAASGTVGFTYDASGHLIAVTSTAEAPGCPDDTDCDGIPNAVEIAQGTNPNAPDNDIFSNTRLFAMQMFRDFLHREGDPGGISYWSNQLNSHALTREDVIHNFLASNEFQGRIAPVVRLYFAYFLRIPDYEGLNYWVSQFSDGQSLANISQAFATSAEFQNRYGALNNSQFITQIYQNVLGRSPESEGLNYWTTQLAQGVLNRGEIMVAFSESSEYKATSANTVNVTMLYIGMLQRAPDQNGLTYWVNQLKAGASINDLIRSFLTATEYHNRFLP